MSISKRIRLWSFFSSACIAVGLTTTPVLAEVITTNAIVKEVDAKEMSITITKSSKTKSKDITLEIGKKSQILIDGKSSKLEAIKPGQNVSVSYETELEVITKIEVGETRDDIAKELVLNDATFNEDWELASTGEKPSWVIRNGILKAKSDRSSLATKQTFEDFDLHLEFKLPSKCNSGIYLRGRYEIQLLDSNARTGMGKPFPPTGSCGAIYGLIAPSSNEYLGTNEWNTLDVRLSGKVATVRMNDIVIIENYKIPQPTSGALSTNEDGPGPIVLQGTNIPGLEFRNITINSIVKENPNK